MTQPVKKKTLRFVSGRPPSFVDKLEFSPAQWKRFFVSIRKTMKTHTLEVNGWQCWGDFEQAEARIRAAGLPCTLVWRARKPIAR